MKRFCQLLSLLVALMMLPFAGLAESTDTVIATVNGKQVPVSEVQQAYAYYYDYYAQYGYSFTYSMAMEAVISEYLLNELIAEGGFDQFTEEEKAALTLEAQAAWDEALQSYVDYYLTEDTDEARAALYAQADAYYRSQGHSPESVAASYLTQEAYSRYQKSLVSPDAVTPEQIQAHLNEIAASQIQQFGDDMDIMMYEYYPMYTGQDFYFAPAGYRRVLHILMRVDDSLMTAYNEAKENWETLSAALADQQEAETADTVPEAEAAEPAEAAENAEAAQATPESDEAEEVIPVTQEMVDEAALKMQEALEQLLASKKTEIDDIEQRLENGESFAEIAQDYNEDTGEDYTAGYMVHPESVVLDPAFTAAAFSEEMTAPGAHAKPIVGMNGIHILYYLADVPEGPFDLSDPANQQLAEEIRDELVSELVSEAINAAITAKRAAADITINNELLNSLEEAEEDVEISFDEDEEEEAVSADEAAPEEAEAPADEAAPEEAEAPADEAASEEVEAPADEAAPEESEAPADEAAPEEAEAPAEEAAE